MNLREVKKKVKSVKNVKQITKAMQMVSAVKMRKAQQQAQEAEPYRVHLEQAIQKIVGDVTPDDSPLLQGQKEKNGKNLYIIVSANKGLSGAFLPGLYRKILSTCNVPKDDFITLGKKGTLFLASLNGDVIADYTAAHLTMQTSAVLHMAIEKFLSGMYGEVHVVYNKFISTMRSEPTIEKMLPIDGLLDTQQETHTLDMYRIEPTPQEIIDSVLRDYLETKLRTAIMSSEAAEHSARMIAMKSATDNAQEVIESLTSTANKLRQERITNELLDMITAKESVET